MPEVDPVTLRLFVDEGRAVASLNKYGRVADQQFSLVEKGARGVESALGSLKGVLAGVSAAALAKSFLDIADTAKTLDAQLKLATTGFGTFAQAQEDVRRIALSTRSGLEETASLYGNFSRGAKELGADQEAAARATETFSKTLKISGADAGQASSATLQFGQALAAGALRGDELNSVLEASPRLARLLTESMGKPIGEIKALGEAGKLTSQVLLNALTNTKFTAGVDAEFRELPVTFDQAMTQVNNAAIITFGAFDRGGQFSTALANFITDGTGGFADLEKSAESFGISARANIEGLASAFAPVFAEGQRLFAFLGSGFAGVDIGRDIQKSLDQIDAGTKFLSGGTAIEKAVNKALTGREDLSTNFGGRFRAARASSEKRRRGEIAEEKTTALISPYLDRFGRPVQRAAPARPAVAKPAGGVKKTGGGANSAESASRKAENDRLKSIRDQANSAREAARLDDDILAARAALATAAEDVLRYQLDAIESERQQQVNDIETQVKLGQLGREEADRRILVNSELAGLRGDLVKRRAAEAIATREAARSSDAADTLRAEAGLLTSRQELRDVELRILDYAYKEEEAAIRRAAAAGEIADLDEALANMRRRRVAQTEGINRQNEGPLARYRRDLDNPDRGKDQVESAVIDELEGVRDSISSAVQKTLGIKNPILAALIDSFIEQQFIKPLLDGMAGAGGGGGSGGLVGSIVSGIGSLFGGARAAGGPVQAGKTYLVGEKGQELFRPSTSGTIVPNHQLVGAAARGMTTTSAARPSQSTTIVNAPQFNLRGAVVTAELYADMQRISEQSATRAGQTAYSQSMRDAPGAVRRAQRFRTT